MRIARIPAGNIDVEAPPVPGDTLITEGGVEITTEAGSELTTEAA